MIDLENEKKLVEAAKKDINAFGELYDIYIARVYNFVARMVGNNEDAEDIVSEAFEKAMLNINKFEYRGYSFGAWLFRIARNLVYDRSKSKELKNLSLEDYDDYIGREDLSPEKETHRQLMSKQLFSSLESLKSEQKEVVILRYIEEYSIKEVSDILNKSEDSVKSLTKRGLAKLREIYENTNE